MDLCVISYFHMSVCLSTSLSCVVKALIQATECKLLNQFFFMINMDIGTIKLCCFVPLFVILA